MEIIQINPTTPRAPIAFTVTDANAFTLIADFKRAARAADWSDTQVDETVAQAMLGNYHHLQCTLAGYTADSVADFQR